MESMSGDSAKHTAPSAVMIEGYRFLLYVYSQELAFCVPVCGASTRGCTLDMRLETNPLIYSSTTSIFSTRYLQIDSLDEHLIEGG